MIIVSVKKRSGKLSKGHGKVEYDIVTQVTVLLDATISTVRRVTELVGKQVDSKCYPLLENEERHFGSQPGRFSLQIAPG